MKAILVKDEYSDITLEWEYDIDRIYSDGHIKLMNSQRRYWQHHGLASVLQ